MDLIMNHRFMRYVLVQQLNNCKSFSLSVKGHTQLKNGLFLKTEQLFYASSQNFLITAVCNHILNLYKLVNFSNTNQLKVR